MNYFFIIKDKYCLEVSRSMVSVIFVDIDKYNAYFLLVMYISITKMEGIILINRLHWRGID